MSKEQNFLQVNFDDIYWDIKVIRTDKLNGEDPVIELQWGWTAGMTDEEHENVAEDSPTGYNSVKILLSQLPMLIHRLSYELACGI